MATSPDILCGICEAQHITKFADHWCPECDEGCAYCEAHFHKFSKGTRNHGIIYIEHYQKMPSSISEIGHHCKDHDMKYKMFCQSMLSRLYFYKPQRLCRTFVYS